MGTWLRTNEGQDICMSMDLPINDPNNVRLSTLLGEYYGTIKVGNRILNMKTEFGTNLISNLRFSNFLQALKSTDFRLNILTQSILYQLVNYRFSGIGKSDFENTIKAYISFESWCIAEFNKLRSASIDSKNWGIPFAECINEYIDLSYLSLSNHFISSTSNNMDSIIDNFINYYPKQNRLSDLIS